MEEGKKPVGRPKLIPSPEILIDLFEAYCDEVNANPWMKQEVVKSGWMAGTIIDVPTALPYTWESFESYLFKNNIAASLKDYRGNTRGQYDEFSEVIREIEVKIYGRNVDGAAVGAFKENLIARYLGISDKQEIKASVEQPLFPEDPEDEED